VVVIFQTEGKRRTKVTLDIDGGGCKLKAVEMLFESECILLGDTIR
jgi:hypothetical protein